MVLLFGMVIFINKINSRFHILQYKIRFFVVENLKCQISLLLLHYSFIYKILLKLSACPIFKRTFGAIPQCEQRSDGHIVCNVTCRPGYSFIAGNTPLPEYTCGFNTSYVWNGEPPACGSIKYFFLSLIKRTLNFCMS